MRRLIVHNYFPGRDDILYKGASWLLGVDSSRHFMEHAVSRVQEEQNRKQAYQQHGIQRVGDEDTTLKAIAEAKRIDPLRYLSGLRKLIRTPDEDQWNADYTPEIDTVRLQAKFDKKDYVDKLQTLLHEAGHRGREIDPETFSAFCNGDRGLIKLPHFLAMANRVHRLDYDQNGTPRDMPDEIFAESYARFALGLPVPALILDFWKSRVRQRVY